MRVDVEIMSEDGKLMRQLSDSSEVMEYILQRGRLVGGASSLPAIRPDRPTEFRSDALAGLLVDFVALQDVARSDAQRRHLASLIELLGEALGVQVAQRR